MENGTVTFSANHRDPFDSVFTFIRMKADSVVIACFGRQFFSSNIRWNPNWSAFYVKMTGFDWFDETNERPDHFLIRYDVNFGGHWYAEKIEFQLDGGGTVIDEWKESVLGLASCGTTDFGCRFDVTRKRAKRLAKASGLRSNRGPYIHFLDWHRIDTTTGEWLGEYEWVVARLRVKELEANEVTWRFDGIVIDPWTGILKKKITLRRHLLVEEDAAVDTGLIRDDR